MLEDYSDLLSIQELQEVLNIGRNTAYELLNQGSVPAFRIGRCWKIPKDSVIHYISQWKKRVNAPLK